MADPKACLNPDWLHQTNPASRHTIGTPFRMLTKNSIKFILASVFAAVVVIGLTGCDGAEKPSKMVEGRAQMMKQREEMKKTYGSTPVVPGK
jgi:predicted aminopeptidase